MLKDNKEATRKAANEKLAEQVRAMAGLAYINVANAQGAVRASSIPDSVGKVKVPDRAYFQKAMKGKINVSEVYLASITGKPAFSVAASLKDGGQALGIIFGVSDLAKFS